MAAAAAVAERAATSARRRAPPLPLPLPRESTRKAAVQLRGDAPRRDATSTPWRRRRKTDDATRRLMSVAAAAAVPSSPSPPSWQHFGAIDLEISSPEVSIVGLSPSSTTWA